MADNESGRLRTRVHLSVKDPISMVTVIGIIISGLLLCVILIVFLVLARKSRQYCFKGIVDFDPQTIRIERKRETTESDVERLSDLQTSSSQEQMLFPASTAFGR